TYLRIREAHHLPACARPITAVPRISIEALHGVRKHSLEKQARVDGFPDILRDRTSLHGDQNFGLLFSIQFGETLSEPGARGGVGVAEAVAIQIPRVAKWTAELNVNEIDDLGPAGAGILVRGNQLVANGRESARFTEMEKAPR